MTRSILALIVAIIAFVPPMKSARTFAQTSPAPAPPRQPRLTLQLLTYTHFVRPDGSPTSFCTSREPCSLARAVALIGTASMRPGSLVQVQYGVDGVYSQAALNFNGSGTAAEPIRFIGEPGVRLSGLRARPAAAQWARVAGFESTWRLAWDEAANFIVGNVAQRPPVTTWQPIRVDDRLPPFTQSMGRPFSLEFPVKFTPRNSVAAVDAQHCTFWHDRPNGYVYVHMCHDGPPAEADNLFLGSSGWGGVVINGDYLSLENIAIEQVTGTALKVNPSATGTVLRSVTARAAQVWLEGVDTLAEDLDVSHVIVQGTHATQCYDANPDFGRGECWNAAGDGRALLIGRGGRTSSYNQVVRRAKVHRSWNGGRVDGRQTLEDSTFWGFANHTLEASGAGGVIRNNVFLNGQDSIYLEGEPFDDLTVEHNLFVNATLFWVSRDRVGGTPPGAWRFRYNILPAIGYDDKTYPAVTADCNLWIPSSGSTRPLMQVTGTDGAGSVVYQTLDLIRAQTPLERNSMALPSSQWTDGSLFTRFTGQTSMQFDFTPVNPDAMTLCGRVVGPDMVRRAQPRASY